MHWVGLTCIDFSADSTITVTGSSDNTGKIASLHTGKAVGTLQGNGIHFPMNDSVVEKCDGVLQACFWLCLRKPALTASLRRVTNTLTYGSGIKRRSAVLQKKLYCTEIVDVLPISSTRNPTPVVVNIPDVFQMSFFYEMQCCEQHRVNFQFCALCAGHTDSVECCCFVEGSLPLVLTGSLDGNVLIWDQGSLAKRQNLTHPQVGQSSFSITCDTCVKNEAFHVLDMSFLSYYNILLVCCSLKHFVEACFAAVTMSMICNGLECYYNPVQRLY